MSDPPDGKPPQLNYARRVRRPQGWWWWMMPLLVGGTMPAAAPRALLEIIERCTKARPDERPSSMREVSDSLRELHANLTGARAVPNVRIAAPVSVATVTIASAPS